MAGIRIHTGGKIPFGYKVEEQQVRVLVLDESVSDIISIIQGLATNGKSHRDIAAILDRMRFPSPEGTRWAKSTISRILLKPKPFRRIKRLKRPPRHIISVDERSRIKRKMEERGHVADDVVRFAEKNGFTLQRTGVCDFTSGKRPTCLDSTWKTLVAYDERGGA